MYIYIPVKKEKKKYIYIVPTIPIKTIICDHFKYPPIFWLLLIWSEIAPARIAILANTKNEVKQSINMDCYKKSDFRWVFKKNFLHFDGFFGKIIPFDDFLPILDADTKAENQKPH